LINNSSEIPRKARPQGNNKKRQQALGGKNCEGIEQKQGDKSQEGRKAGQQESGRFGFQVLRL